MLHMLQSRFVRENINLFVHELLNYCKTRQNARYLKMKSYYNVSANIENIVSSDDKTIEVVSNCLYLGH